MQAAKEYGKESLTIYQARFVGMYYAVCEHKNKTYMKIICTGPDEKVYRLIDTIVDSIERID